MNKKEKTSLSRFISLVLRHKPEVIGLCLDPNGWADVDSLISNMQKHGRNIDRETLNIIVAEDEKNRYSFNDDRTKIRANQGHSLSVDVELKEANPPSVLYHGTAMRYIDAIKQVGLISKGRLYVHLSVDIITAEKVGKRHGKPIVLKIDSSRMLEDGFKFFISENGVWLTKEVPVDYILFE